ncbi:MAG: 30S ribosomal protein S9 [Planctomycetota bacterium]|nr:30S ribosomal protein S9 [Planctomycetota bacterium]
MAPADRKTAGYIWGTGRRKTATARVRIRPGQGQFVINGRPLKEYFPTEVCRKAAISPLTFVKMENTFDVFVNVRGGGTTGQAEAIRLGVARALVEYDQNLEKGLREEGYLTRDPRKVERKKYGRPGARKRFQYSKR